MCLCYTNHALDSFLEALITSGVDIDSVKRLGDSEKISELIRNCKLEKGKFNRDELMQSREVTAELEQQEKLANGYFDLLSKHSTWNRNSWSAIKASIEFDNSIEILVDQLRNPVLNDSKEVLVGKKGKNIADDYTFML